MDRRRFPRYDIKGKLTGQVILSSHVQLLDISIGGVKFLTTKRIDPNSNCTFTINLKDKKVCVKAQVVRSMLRGTKKVENDYLPIYEVALEFTDIESSKSDIEKVIKELDIENITIK